MGSKKQAPGKGPTNEQFLAGVFGETHNTILVCSFKGHPKDAPQSAWVPFKWREDYAWDDQANNYFTVSTFTGKNRRKRDFVALHVVMVDDVILNGTHVGGKIPREAIALPPTYAIETSPGNAQVGYKLTEPVTDLTIATRLIAGIAKRVSPDETDPGMLGVTRYAKLPQGVNGKHGHVNRMKGWHPERTYTVRELCAAYDLDYEALIEKPKPVLFDTEKYPEGGPVVEALDWYAQLGSLKEETPDKFELTCPWVDGHSEDRDDGCAIGKPGSHPELPGFWFKCHHGSCQDRTLNDFMSWCREQGFGKTDAAADFAGLEDVDLEYEPPKPEPATGFKLFSYDNLDPATPPPRQLVEDVLVYGEMTLISAQPNTGKSAFALDLAEHVAAGDPWHGKLVEQCTALYVCAESPATIESRMRAIRARRGGSVPLYGTYDPITLTTEADRSLFSGKMKATLRELPGTNLIIVDTFRSATPGIDESDAKEISPVVTYLHRMAHELGVHVILVHHTTKAGTSYSGSGVFGAIVDTEIVIWDETDLDGETEGHDNRGCIVAHIRQQRGLASKNEEFFYLIESAETGRTNNFGKLETAPVVRQVSQMELDMGQAERESAEEERARLDLEADLERMVHATLADPSIGKARLAQLLSIGERRVDAVRQFGLDRGVLGTNGRPGNGCRWHVIPECDRV